MNPELNAIPAETINLNQTDSGFVGEVIRRSGVDINKCWHCQTCAGGCPFVRAMDYPPNRVIRMVQLGLRKEALESSGIWICVGCNTCSIQCPNCIDIPAVNDALRQMAMAEGAVVAEPMVNEIIQGAIDAGADCIVTACAMCHMNLEVRCSLKEKVPVLHFSEIISLALGIAKSEYKGWFSRHLVDPKPLLKALDLL